MVEAERIAMSSRITMPGNRFPLLSMSRAGSESDPVTVVEISCKSMLSLTTIPRWSPSEEQVWHETFFPPLIT